MLFVQSALSARLNHSQIVGTSTALALKPYQRFLHACLCIAGQQATKWNMPNDAHPIDKYLQVADTVLNGQNVKPAMGRAWIALAVATNCSCSAPKLQAFVKQGDIQAIVMLAPSRGVMQVRVEKYVC
jgi:hypothetical protein